MQPFPHNRSAGFLAAGLTVIVVCYMLVGVIPGHFGIGWQVLVILGLHSAVVFFLFRRHLGWEALLVAIAFSLFYFGIIYYARHFNLKG